MKTLPVKRLTLFFPSHQSFSKHLPHKVIVRFFLELESLHILEIAIKSESIFTIGFEEIVYLSHLLESSYFLVLLSFAVDLNTLPGEFPNQEVEEQVPQRLQIISSALFISFVRSNTGIASSSYETLSSLDGYVLTSLEVSVSFSKAKVNDVDRLAVLPAPSHEVVSLDIPVYKSLSMDLLKSCY